MVQFQTPAVIYTFCFYAYCWIGLGTPFIWMKSFNQKTAGLFQMTQHSITLLIFLIFSTITIVNINFVILYVKKNIYLMFFVFYISVSLLWSPIGNSEKIFLFATILICGTAAFFALISLGWQKTWLVVMFSLTGYFLVTAICSQLVIYPAPRQLVFAYGIAFIVGFLALLLFLAPHRFRPGSIQILIATILLMGATAIFLLPVAFSGFKELDWGHFRLSVGLFLNPNLLSRLLQILFIAVFITALDFMDWSSEKSLFIFCLSLIILLLCSFALFEHRASIGRLVMVATLSIFIVSCVYKALNMEYPRLSNLFVKRFFAAILLMIFLITALWNYQNIDQIISKLSTIFEREDLLIRYNIWSSALSLPDIRQLVFGVGLDGFWSGGAKLSQLDSFLKDKAHAHNGIVDLVLQTGFLSVSLLLLALVQSFVNLSNDKKTMYFTKLAVLLALGGFASMNIFESALLPVSSAAMLPFTLLIFTLIFAGSLIGLTGPKLHICSNFGT